MTTLPAPTPSASRPPMPRPTWFGGNMPVARCGLILNLLVPLALLLWDAAHHALGADATNYATHTTGWLAVMCLLLSLCVTPLRQITGWSWLVQFRRSLGVYGFYYAALHLVIYFWWWQARSVSATVHEITHRWYLVIGFTSLALMAPLWATSFDAAIRRLGGKNWKRLHRLAYPAAVLAGVHYYLQSKSDKTRPTAYLAVLVGLLAWRVGAVVVGRIRRGRTGAATPARTWKGELRVAEMVKETPGVTTFRLFPADGCDLPLDWKAGQYLNLAVGIDGQRVNRSYTIASPPTRKDHLELTIKRETNGRVSRFLHDKLMTGDTVGVSGPAGKFTFDPAGEKAVLLIAGGVGVTPVMSILRDLTDRRWSGRIDFVFSVHTPTDVIFAEELERLEREHDNLHVHLTCTRDTPDDWQGHRSRIDAALVERLVPDFKSRRTFLCGPDAMADAVRASLKSAGVPEEKIVVESFTPAPAKTAAAGAADGQAVSLTFSRSGTTTKLRPGQTVLDAAEVAGVDIPFVCRSGICGTCKCKLVDGNVTQAVDDALTEADKADGYVLTCQAYADGDVTIDA